MLQIWIEDSLGNRLGSGPIYTAANWQNTAYLDKAGNFNFTMPASDPRANDVQIKRIARCWHFDGKQWRTYGAGIIERREFDGDTLRVSGDDLLSELTYRSIPELELINERRVHPSGFQLLHVSPALAAEGSYRWADLDVGDTETWQEIGGLGENGNDYYYLSFHRRFKAFQVVLSDGNQVVTELFLQYYNPKSRGWDYTQIINDGTNVNGAPFAVSGRIDFEMPSDWGTENVVTNTTTYDIRIGVQDVALENFTLFDITVIYNAPVTDALTTVAALAPAGWSLDAVNGYTTTKPAMTIGDNVIKNGSFENGSINVGGATDNINDWEVIYSDAASRVKLTTTDVYDGTYALNISSDPEGSNQLIGQQVEIDPNTDYELVIYTHNDGNTDERVCAAFCFYDTEYSSGNPSDQKIIDVLIRSDPMRAASLTNIQDMPLVGLTYRPYTYYYTSPVSRDSVYFMLWGNAFNHAGDIYVDNIVMKRYLAGEIYLSFSGETVLEAFNRLAEQTGEHFILSPTGRKVLWLRDDQRDSGIRLINQGDPIALESDDRVALIVDRGLQEITDAYDLCSRVYAFGGGNGDNRISLKNTTRSAPDGYVLDTTEGYLERTGAVTALGRIDRYINFDDIIPKATDDTQITFAANSLFDRTYQWLSRHSATNTNPITGDVPRAFTIEVAKLERILLPGYYTDVYYRSLRDGVLVTEINTSMCVLSASYNITDRGVATTRLELGTIDAPLWSDIEIINQSLRKQHTISNRTPETEKYSSSGIGVVVSQAVRNGRVTGVSRFVGASGTLTVDTGAGTGSVTLRFKDGVYNGIA